MSAQYFISAKFFESITVLVVGILLLVFIKTVDNKYLKPKSENLSWYHSTKAIFSFINFLIFVIVLLVILSINGVNVGKYFASLGIAGVVASFALQDFLKDIVMGISIMFENYFAPGDVVVYEGREGKVVSFNIKTTKLFMMDDESTMSVCNRNITQIALASDWVDIDVPVGYDTDLYVGRSISKEAAKKIERLKFVYSCDFQNTQELGESWITYKLRVHCRADKKPLVRRASYAVVQDVFYENNVQFPLGIKVIYNVDPSTVNNGTVVPDGADTKDFLQYKKTYELGKGAEVSKKCIIDSSDDSFILAINEAERYAGSENLSKKTRLRMRLVAEELFSIMRCVKEIYGGTFYIERVEDDDSYMMCYDADAKVDYRTRAQILKSTDNAEKDIYSGLSGVITKAIDSMMIMSNSASGKLEKGMDKFIKKNNDTYDWSLKEFESHNGQNIEIGKSVLNKLADEVKISVKRNKILFRITIKVES